MTRPLGIRLRVINDQHLGKDDVPLCLYQQLQVYRMCLTQLENMIQHSGCKAIEFQIRIDPAQLLITFRHDGCGLNNERADYFLQHSSGTGLKSCKARAQILGASLRYEEEATHYRITINVPIA